MGRRWTWQKFPLCLPTRLSWDCRISPWQTEQLHAGILLPWLSTVRWCVNTSRVLSPGTREQEPKPQFLPPALPKIDRKEREILQWFVKMGKNMVLTCFSGRFLVDNHFFGSSPYRQGSSDTQIDGYHHPTTCHTCPLVPGDHQHGEILVAAQLLTPLPSPLPSPLPLHSPLAVIYLPSCSYHFKLQVCFRNVEFIMYLMSWWSLSGGCRCFKQARVWEGNCPQEKNHSHAFILLRFQEVVVCNFNYFDLLLKQRARFGSAAPLPPLMLHTSFSGWLNARVPLLISTAKQTNSHDGVGAGECQAGAAAASVESWPQCPHEAELLGGSSIGVGANHQPGGGFKWEMGRREEAENMYF